VLRDRLVNGQRVPLLGNLMNSGRIRAKSLEATDGGQQVVSVTLDISMLPSTLYHLSDYVKNSRTFYRYYEELHL